MFQVVILNVGYLNEIYYFILGFFGQLIICFLLVEVDVVVIKVFLVKYNLFVVGDSIIVFDGWKIIYLFFSLGVVCLDSWVGLDWVCFMVEILWLFNSVLLWCDVIVIFIDYCIKQLLFQLKYINIFILFVLVGFFQVFCVGICCVYMDNVNEFYNVIILKYFIEKNRVVIVDVKIWKRKIVKDYQLVQKGGG